MEARKLMTTGYHSYPQEIEVGLECYFGALWDGNGDEEGLLESGCVAVYYPDAENFGDFEVVDFEILEENTGNILDTWVRVTCIR